MTTAEATDKKMNSIEKSIDVDVPVGTAYNQWTQFGSFPKFMNSVDKIEQTDDTHTHWRTSIAGKKNEFDAEIVEQVPDKKIAWRSTDGETHAGVVSFEPISDKATRVTVQMDWKPEGVAEKIGAALQLDDVSVQQDLKNFKELIESNGFEEGAWRGEVTHGMKT